jgi:HD-GYP domain-containing protein (c-di-GMP phosphodiesterase class II)
VSEKMERERVSKKEWADSSRDDRITHLLNKSAPEIRAFIEGQLEKVRRLATIGVALSAEKNLGRLLEMIVEEARTLTDADGGTLYTLSDDESMLRFAVVQSSTLKIRMGGTGEDITWSPVPLKNPDGSPNHSNVSAYVALSGAVVNIPDVYDAEGHSFDGTRIFDATTGYRSKSMLVVPMKNHENDIIGVLQILNARDAATGEVIPFSTEGQEMIESLASQAAVALTNNRLIQDLENLLESFVRSIAMAIDEKSPYTGGHVRRVADLTIEIAGKINGASEGPYARVSFDEDEMRELRIAAWLHDVGKVTTAEHVVDKATKLETIWDRIELLKTRFEVLERDRKIELMKGASYQIEDDGLLNRLREDLDLLIQANKGSEDMSDEIVEKVKKAAAWRWVQQGESKPALTDDEILNLSVKSGTLTEDERSAIQNHATATLKILSQLPFPKKLKHVPDYAGAHHEKLDGSGYPLGLKGDQLSLQSRILAMADIFEALTAKDRPYKKGKTLSEAVKIMKSMVKENHLDPELFDFFIKERVYLDYLKRELSPQQIDLEKLDA